jgi:acetyltransferase
MCREAYAHELIAGIADDPTFGPVILIGAGGKEVELIGDRQLGLPPLGNDEAGRMLSETKISRLLKAHRGEPGADIDAIVDVLKRLSAIAAEVPEIRELDINPLLVSPKGVLALDARAVIARTPSTIDRLAIRPAPVEWTADAVTKTGLAVRIRPALPDDEAAVADFFEHVSMDDLRFRFLSGLKEVDRARLLEMVQVDYSRGVTFLALSADRQTVLATATLATDADQIDAEVALATRSDVKGQGVSWVLLDHVIRYAKAEGISVLEAVEDAYHESALQMEREMGFGVSSDPDDPTVRIARKVLSPDSSAARNG